MNRLQLFRAHLSCTRLNQLLRTKSLAVASTAYALPGLVSDQGLPVRYWLIWTAVALVVGPSAAVTGWQVRHGARRVRVIGASALVAVCLAEAFVLWGHIDHLVPHVVYAVMAVVGLLIPWAVLRRDRWQVAAGSTALGCALAVPFALIFEVAFRDWASSEPDQLPQR